MPKPKLAARLDTEKAKRKDKERREKWLPLKVIQTPTGRLMTEKGFVTPEYDAKLEKWKPKQSKRTMVPAPVAFSELDVRIAVAEAEAEEEARPDRDDKPRLPTTKLTFKPVIIKKGRKEFYGAGHKLPVFTNTKLEDQPTQWKSKNKFNYAEIQPPSFFKPHPPQKGDAPRARFAEVDGDHEEEEADVAADSLELSALPTMDSLPELNLESTDAADVAASLSSQESTLMSELESETMDPAQKARARESLATFFTEVKALLFENKH